jgi:hypothetical protein
MPANDDLRETPAQELTGTVVYIEDDETNVAIVQGVNFASVRGCRPCFAPAIEIAAAPTDGAPGQLHRRRELSLRDQPVDRGPAEPCTANHGRHAQELDRLPVCWALLRSGLCVAHPDDLVRVAALPM